MNNLILFPAEECSLTHVSVHDTAWTENQSWWMNTMNCGGRQKTLGCATQRLSMNENVNTARGNNVTLTMC